MHILNLLVENYKRIKLVEIPRNGRVTQITGKNGQGKTSALDSIWAALAGKRGFPEKPVRKGAQKARIRLELDELIVTRTITAAGSHTLLVESKKGVQMAGPQAVLDTLIGERTADPQAWVRMKPKEQADMLRQIAHCEVDFEAINQANARDYEERAALHRDIKRLEAEAASITVQAQLPKEKVNEAAIVQKLNQSRAINQEAFALQRRKDELADKVKNVAAQLEAKSQEIVALQEKVKMASLERDHLNNTLVQTQTLFESASLIEMVDVGALTAEFQQAQLVNREIDKRARKTELETQLTGTRHQAEDLTRAMDRRNEEKMTALHNTNLPIPGLTVDEEQVLFEGVPVSQLGEAEQIKIGARILMAQNPKLRVIFIPHGEALDDDSLEILTQLAEEYDFDIWIAKVDASGKVGVIIEDGMVASASGEPS